MPDVPTLEPKFQMQPINTEDFEGHVESPLVKEYAFLLVLLIHDYRLIREKLLLPTLFRLARGFFLRRCLVLVLQASFVD